MNALNVPRPDRRGSLTAPAGMAAAAAGLTASDAQAAAAAPGSSLLASSRLVLPTPAGPENSSGNYWRQVLISADSQVIIAVIQVEAHHASGRMPGVTQKLVTFPATTGTAEFHKRFRGNALMPR